MDSTQKVNEVLGGAAFFLFAVLGFFTTFGGVYHEMLHVIAYRVVGVEAWITSRASMSCAELHPFGLWFAYPGEVVTYCLLSVRLVRGRWWWVSLATLGMAVGRAGLALISRDYWEIALEEYGEHAVGEMLIGFALVSFPVIWWAGWKTLRRVAAYSKASETAGTPVGSQ